MDFITKLPRSKNSVIGHEYDIILVTVDRLIKYMHFIPTNETNIVEQLRYLTLDRLIRYYGFTKVYIIDRDKLFTSNY